MIRNPYHKYNYRNQHLWGWPGDEASFYTSYHEAYWCGMLVYYIKVAGFFSLFHSMNSISIHQVKEWVNTTLLNMIQYCLLVCLALQKWDVLWSLSKFFLSWHDNNHEEYTAVLHEPSKINWSYFPFPSKSSCHFFCVRKSK